MSAPLSELVWRASGLTAAGSLRLAVYASAPDHLREGDDVLDLFPGGETIGLNGISY